MTRRRRLWGCAAALGLGIAGGVSLPLGGQVAEASPPPQSAPAGPYEDAIARGNALMEKKDYAAAVRAFEAAAAARPGDARALSEQSWAAILAGDLATARTAAEKSIAAAPTPGLKAASYYNLGRAKEAGGDKAGAIAAYTESLKLRESREVRGRLGALGGSAPLAGAAPASDPFARRALLGPFTQLSEFCDKQPTGNSACSFGAPSPPNLGDWSISYSKPFLEVAEMQSGRPGLDRPMYHIAIRVSAGWYVLADLLDAPNRSLMMVREVKPVGERLLVRYEYMTGRFDTEKEAGVVVCGIGADRRPSCTGPIATAHATNVHEGGKIDGTDTTTLEYSCRAELLADGTLQTQDGPPRPFQILADKIVPARPGACAKQPFWGARKLTF